MPPNFGFLCPFVMSIKNRLNNKPPGAPSEDPPRPTSLPASPIVQITVKENIQHTFAEIAQANVLEAEKERIISIPFWRCNEHGSRKPSYLPIPTAKS